MALKKWLVEYMPPAMLAFFSKPYLGGYSLEEALEVARQLYQTKGILSTIDLLGEEVENKQKALENRNVYLKVIEELGHFDMASRPTLSFKPSSITYPTSVNEKKGELHVDESFLRENIKCLLEKGKEAKVGLTMDMEDHRWTELTLEVYLEFLKEGYDFGTVLQTRLFRTKEDIERIPSNGRIRLCIGIYEEPPEIALQDTHEMKEKMVEYGKVLLDKDVYLELATHDEQLIHRFLKEIYLENPKKDFEIQMLLGVPREKIQQKLVEGSFLPGLAPLKVRLYVPFAQNFKDGVAYCRRRLLSNPHMISYGIRNLFGRMNRR
ncbi:MAG: hypothetical protein D6785_13965 [Planctomycetota bacterium]|nr:MAG: hypothetical protein D6785_13965 [Planctomycetota bacterium]